MNKVTDVTIIKAAYVTLMAQGSFPGRYTPEGQTLLSTMRDRIAEVEGRSDQDVQDECCLLSMNAMGPAWAMISVVRDLGILK